MPYAVSLVEHLSRVTEAEAVALVIVDAESGKFTAAPLAPWEPSTFNRLFQSSALLRDLVVQLYKHGGDAVLEPLDMQDSADEGDESDEAWSELKSLCQNGLVLAAPATDGESPYGVVLAIIQPTSPARSRVRMELVNALLRQSEKWFEKQRLANANRAIGAVREEADCVRRIAENLNQRDHGYALANELQTLFDCGRVSYFAKKSGSLKPIAFSGQAKSDKRPTSVRRLTKLANAALKAKRDLWIDGDETLAPQIDLPFQQYRDESNVNSLAILPLTHSKRQVNPTDQQRVVEMVNELDESQGEVVGGVVLEQFDRPLDRAMIESKWERLRPGLQASATNSANHHAIFLMPLWLTLGRFFQLYMGNTKKKAIAITSAVVAVIAALVFVPADLKIRCDGVLQPAERQNVFAIENGVVVGIPVVVGDRVSEGDVLLRQENNELEEELVAASGELSKLKAERQSLLPKFINQRMRGGGDSEDEGDSRRIGEIEASILSKKRVVDLLKERRETLDVRAAFSGVVFAWNSGRRFQNRPLATGDRLFTVGNIEGPWQLELKVPDTRAGYVTRAWTQASQRTDEPLKVTFRRNSDPSKQFTAFVTSVPANLEVGPKEEVILPITATVDRDALDGARPGTSVVAQVHCGRTSLGHAKLYEFFDWLRRTWFKFVY